MKAKTTWVLLADAKSAKIVVNEGPGRGFADVPGKRFTASPPTDYADAPGQGRSSHGPGRAALARRDPKALASKAFAERLASDLAESARQGAFERLVLVAGPHMLGELRTALAEAVRERILGELDKDLIHATNAELPAHLADILAA
ncbi:MAG: host attachment protein [Pseudomonadota bacterium]